MMFIIMNERTSEWYRHAAEIFVVKREGFCKNLDDKNLVST